MDGDDSSAAERAIPRLDARDVAVCPGDQRQGKKGTKRIHGAAGYAVKGGQRGAVWGLDAGRWRRANNRCVGVRGGRGGVWK